jgi:PAS domain S-box-containing protein
MTDTPIGQPGEAWASVQLALGALPVPVLVTDLSGEALWANSEFLTATGKSAHELAGPAQNHIQFGSKLAEILAANSAWDEPWQGEVSIPRNGLVELHSQLIITLLKPAPDQPSLLLWTLRHPVPQGMDPEETHFRSLFQNMSEGVAYCRMFFEDGHPVDYLHLVVNNAFEPLTGLKNVLGRMVSEVIPGLRESNRHILEVYGRVARSGQPEKFETFVDGLSRWYSISVYSPKPEYFVAVFENITDRKRDERDLSSLATAIEQAGEQVVITDERGIIQYCNPAFERVTGYTKEEVIGLNPSILKSGCQPAEFYDRLWTTIANGQMWSGKFTNRRKDGSYYHEEATISPIRDGQQRIVGYVAVKRDATERLQLEGQLRQAQKLESIGRLAGGVAHDFNNLLTVINGFAGFLLKDLAPNDPLRSHALQISKAGDRAASLTRQLLAFSRHSISQPRALDLNTVVRETESMLRRLIGEDVELITLLDPFLGQAMADPDQIHQVVMNLVVNARDAMPNGGKLIIETSNVYLDELYVAGHPEAKCGACVLMTVTDSGHGMDEATRSSIFEPFFTTKEPGKGTGLGLSTVYGIVRQSQGWIWVYSEPGQGATFKVYLPRIDAVVDAASASPLSPSGLGGNETILVVEDQDDVRALTRAVLHEYGYDVLEAANAAAALELSEKHQGFIHLLLTDVVLPGMNGRELADRMKLLRPEARVLFTSGYTADVIAHRGVLDQGVAFIAKPFAPDGLAARVRQVLLSPLPGGSE